MTITFANLGSSQTNPVSPDIRDTTTASSYLNSIWTPPTSGLIICFVANFIAAVGNIPTMSGNNLAWKQIATVAVDPGTSHRITLFAADATGSVSGTNTIYFAGQNQLGCIASFFSADGVDITSTGVTGAFVQKPTNNATTGITGSVVLASALDSNNRPIACFVHQAQELSTPNSSWSEVDDMTMAGPTSGLETQWDSDGFQNASATWTTSAAWIAMAAELKATIGNTYNDDVSLARSGTLTDSTSVDMFPSTSLAKSDFLSDTNTLDMFPAISLNQSNTMSDGGVMTMEEVLGALQRVMSVSAIGGLDFESAVSLARSAFISTDKTLTLDESFLLAKNLAIALSNDVALAAAVSLAQTYNISTSVLTDFLVSLALNRSDFINQSATIDIEAAVTIAAKVLRITTISELSGQTYNDSLSMNKVLLTSLLPDLVMSSALSLSHSNQISLNAENVLIASISLNAVKAISGSVQADLAAALSLNKIDSVSTSTLADLTASLPVSLQLGIGMSSLADFLAQVDLSRVNQIAFLAGQGYDATLLLNKIISISTSSDTLVVVVFPGTVIIMDSRITSVLASDVSLQTTQMGNAGNYIVTAWDE